MVGVLGIDELLAVVGKVGVVAAAVENVVGDAVERDIVENDNNCWGR